MQAAYLCCSSDLPAAASAYASCALFLTEMAAHCVDVNKIFESISLPLLSAGFSLSQIYQYH